MSNGTYVQFRRRAGVWVVRIAGQPDEWAFTAWGAKRLARHICKTNGLPAPMFANPDGGTEG